MTALWIFLADVGDTLAVISPSVSAIGTIAGSITAGMIVGTLQDDASFARIRDWAKKPGPAARYRDLIAWGLKSADRLYGPKPGPSWRGYKTCLLVALLYPVFLMHLAWVLGGPVSIAGVEVFKDSPILPSRWAGLFLLWSVLSIFGVVIARSDRFTTVLSNALMRPLHRAGLNRKIAGFVARGAVSVVVAGGVVVAGVAFVAVVAGGAVSAVGAGVAFVAGVAVVAYVTVVAVVAGFTFVAGFTVVVGGAVVTVSAVSAGGAVMWATLFLVIPAANALLDHGSVQVSRWLLADLIDRRSTARQTLMVLGHIAADAIFAACFLVLLAVLLPAILQSVNWLFYTAGWPPVAWGSYLNAARADPFGAGLMVTGMLATTLIPTILHLLAAGGALALPRIGGGLIGRLAAQEETSFIDRAALAGLIAISLFLSWAALAVVAIVLWKATEAFVGPLGGIIADIALDVGRAVGGPGAP